MDTRKLKARTGFKNDKDAWSLMDGDLVFADILGLKSERAANAAELTRRWNAYPELVKRLEECADLLHASADEKAEAGSYGRDCHKAETKARTLLQTIKP